MFLANSLKEKLKRTNLENDFDTANKAPFAFSEKKQDLRVLLTFKGKERGLPPLPNEEFTTQKLKGLDEKEWENKFTLSRLRNEWKTKVEIDFENKFKKFPEEIVDKEVKYAKEYVKEFIDRCLYDILSPRLKQAISLCKI